jgi:hypothetical protein
MFLGKNFKATKFVNVNIQSKLAVYFTISHSISILLISSSERRSAPLARGQKSAKNILVKNY